MSSGGTTNLWAAGTILARLVLASGAATSKDSTSMTGLTAATGTTDQSLVSGNMTKTTDNTNDRVVFDNTGDLTWSAVTAGSVINRVVIYKDGANDAARVPLSVYDCNITSNGSDITGTFSADGVIYLQQ